MADRLGVALILRVSRALKAGFQLRPSSVLTFALASACLCVLAGPARSADLVDRLVRIRAIATDGTTNVGSGVIIGPERVATACHVTRRASAILVIHGDQQWQAIAQVGSEPHDLCVLRVSTNEPVPVPMRRSEELRVGETVTAVGFEGSGRDPVVGSGIVAGLYRYDGGYVIRTSAHFDFGSSGGGLFDEAGNLVGILAFKARSGENLRFALPSEWLSPTNPVAESFAPVSSDSCVTAFWERTQADRPAFLGVALHEATTRER
jgi:serine protease Do